jgi:hypothetical protein
MKSGAITKHISGFGEKIETPISLLGRIEEINWSDSAYDRG